MFCPPIYHERTPQSRPRHRPRPAGPSLHSHPCHPFEYDLHDGADSHQKEESPSRDEFGPTPNTPYADIVGDSRYGECTHECAGLPKEHATGTSSESDVKMSEGLVPTGTPELADRCGHPWAVKGTWP